MRGFRSMVLLTVAALGGALLVGCTQDEPVKSKPEPVTIVPASPEQADQIRAEILKSDATARVGMVERVSPADALATVSGLSPEDVKKGDTVEFVDGRQNPIAGGTVIFRNGPTDPYLTIEYKPGTGGRAPVRGDVVVYLPKH